MSADAATGCQCAGDFLMTEKTNTIYSSRIIILQYNNNCLMMGLSVITSIQDFF